MVRYTTRPQGTVTELYDELRTTIARIVAGSRALDLEDREDRGALTLDDESATILDVAPSTRRRLPHYQLIPVMPMAPCAI